MSAIFKTQEGRAAILGAYREILAAWPAPNKQYAVKTDYGDTFVIESGEAANPALLLLHGSVSNSFVWFGDVTALSERYHVFAVDIIGEAGLSAESRPAYQSGAYPKWLEQVRQAVGVETWSIAGLSLGGWMALQYASAYPQRVHHLALLCPGGLAREKMGFRFRAMLNRLTGNRGKQKLLQSVLNEKTMDEGLKKGLMFTLMIGQHFNPRMAKLPIIDGKTLARLVLPVLIVFGEKDPLLRPEASIRHLKRYAPRVQADVLPGVGHVVVGQAARILEFFGKDD